MAHSSYYEESRSLAERVRQELFKIHGAKFETHKAKQGIDDWPFEYPTDAIGPASKPFGTPLDLKLQKGDTSKTSFKMAVKDNNSVLKHKVQSSPPSNAVLAAPLF